MGYYLAPFGLQRKGPELALRPGIAKRNAYLVRDVSLPSPLIAACAAASRAIGTRNGEQDT